MSEKIQVCLVSAQPTPNVLPILDPKLRPDKIILLTSKQMQTQASNLEGLYQRLQIQTEVVEIDAYNANAIIECLLELLAEYEASDLTLNVTGGTKIMAIVAQEIFRNFDRPVFYISEQDDRILELSTFSIDQGEKFKEVQIDAPLKLDILLQAHGWRAERGTNPPRQLEGAQKKYVDQLVLHVEKEKYQQALSMMNGLGTEAERRKELTFELTERENNNREFCELIERAIKADLISEDPVHGNRVSFANVESRDFLRGGWLERYVFDQVRSLRKDIGLKDVEIGLNVIKNDQSVSNELDIAFIARNQLYIIECKTALMQVRGATGEESRGVEAIYKLEALADMLGGLRTSKMLVSFRQLSEADRKRARENRIEVVDRDSLRRLNERIKSWVGG